MDVSRPFRRLIRESSFCPENVPGNSTCAFAGRFFAIGAIYEPFHYIVVAGAYDSSVPGAIFGLGILKMFDLSLTRYQQEQSAPTVEPSFSTQRPWKVFSPARLPSRVAGG